MAKANGKNLKPLLKEKFANAFTGENIAKAIFFAFAAFSVLAVFGIIFYVLGASIPAFREIGFFKFVSGSQWSAANGIFGILPMIATSLALTLTSVFFGGILAVFTAVFMVYYCPKRLKQIYIQMINLLAGIPSIVYGYFGLIVIKNFLLQDICKVPSAFGLLLSTLVLGIMILPTVTSLVRNSLEAVPMHYYEGALALGCTKNQAVWKVLVPAARNGILAALILGVGRAVGETMAVQLLLGNSVNYPVGLFLPIRSLTSNIVQEFGYSTGLHRQALIATGFILLLFILLINVCLWAVKKNDAVSGNKFFTRKFREGENKSVLSYRKSGSVQDVFWILSCIFAIVAAVALIAIVAFVFIYGLPNLNAELLFGKSKNSSWTLKPAFVSTGLLIIMALAVSLPLGIGAAIFLNEYAKKGSKAVNVIRLFIDTLAGIPSIIFGLFGAIFFGEILKMGYSLMNGSLTLALIVLPTIIRSTEQSLSEVPDSMREASYALGAGKLRTIFLVVLPQAVSGIITSIILSTGRIVGETAALIYTAGAVGLMPSGYGSAGSSLAVMMFHFMNEGLEVEKAYATAAILMIIVVILNILITAVERVCRRRAKI